jgi:hypothetical protein
MLETVVKLDCSEEHYVAWACIIHCFEDRIWRLRNAFFRHLGQQGAEHFDPVSIAGGPMALAEDDPLDKEFVLKQIAISKKKHCTNRVILIFHINCGAYEEMGKVFPSCEEEYRHHEAASIRAEATVKARFPEMEVERYIADFSAIHRVW